VEKETHPASSFFGKPPEIGDDSLGERNGQAVISKNYTIFIFVWMFLF
jgi:hypothetical protein